MRMVLHDWSDDKAVNILRHLCAAAGPETQLVVIDNILSYACTEDSFVGDIPGAVVERLPPSPLLPNLGYAAVSSYLADLSVCFLVLIMGDWLIQSRLIDVELS